MFEQIKKDCPGALEMFVNWITQNAALIPYLNQEQFIINVSVEFLIGWLFRFFDEQGIYIDINFIDPKNKWDCTIWLYSEHGGMVAEECGSSKSRIKAWQAAIPKAFEIYQKQLEEK